jgi:hypothetical protein
LAPISDEHYDYGLTYYVNDISYKDARIIAGYGKRGEMKAAYTYDARKRQPNRIRLG